MHLPPDVWLQVRKRASKTSMDTRIRQGRIGRLPAGVTDLVDDLLSKRARAVVLQDGRYHTVTVSLPRMQLLVTTHLSSRHTAKWFRFGRRNFLT